MNILSIFAGLVILVVFTWLIVIFIFNDFSVPNLNLTKLLGKKKFKSLVIYPHPDDETMASGGLIQKLSKYGEVKVITATKGQYGTELLKLAPDELAKVRETEFINAMRRLDIVNYNAWEFIDGSLIDNIDKLIEKIKETLTEFNPDLVVTYERSGVYGHPDHIALSKAVNKVTAGNRNITVLYATLAEKILRRIKLPTAIDGVPIPEFKKQSLPEFKSFTLPVNIAKFSAAKEYKSQNLSHGFPFELMAGLYIFEYYTTKYDD